MLKALQSIAAAQQELERVVSRHGKIIDSQAEQIVSLEKQVMELRNRAIQAEIASGKATKEVAERYELSPARISQIAPRKGGLN
jgi:DNA-binding NarL/FixJ family response regulator